MGEFGGLNGSYATPMNVVGVGNPVPAGANGLLGSGDKFTVGGKKQKIATKKSANYGLMLPTCVFLK